MKNASTKKGNKSQEKLRRTIKGGKKRRPKTPKRKTPKRKNSKPIVFGHVYSDQCIHCQNMQNDWNTLCKKVSVPLHDIDEDHENQVQQFNTKYQTNLEANGFPTIFRLKKQSSPIDYYNGNRSHKDMKKWLYG